MYARNPTARLRIHLFLSQSTQQIAVKRPVHKELVFYAVSEDKNGLFEARLLKHECRRTAISHLHTMYSSLAKCRVA